MKMYPFADTKATKLFLTLLMTALLYLCRDSMYTTAMLGFNKAYLLTGMVVAITGVVFLVYNRKHWKQILLDRRMGLLAVVTVAMILPMVCKADWQMMYMSVLLCLWIGIFFSFFWDWRDAAKYYVVILTAIGVYSMAATYVLRILPDRDLFHVPVFYNSIGHMFHNFGFSIVSEKYVKLRNFGIFREPSVYHCFILLALFLNNYTVRWKKESRLWIVNLLLSLTMLTTMATGGYVELAILASAVFVHKKLYRSKRVWAVVCVLVLLAVIFLGIIIAQQDDLYWMLYGTFVSKFQPGADSSSDRVDSIVENTRFFLENPLVGAKLASVFDTVPNNTSSSTLMFAIFGILGGLVHVISWVALVWQKDRSPVSNLILLLTLFMAINTQNLIADVHLWLLPMMALSQRGLAGMQNIRKKR